MSKPSGLCFSGCFVAATGFEDFEKGVVMLVFHVFGEVCFLMKKVQYCCQRISGPLIL